MSSLCGEDLGVALKEVGMLETNEIVGLENGT